MLFRSLCHWSRYLIRNALRIGAIHFLVLCVAWFVRYRVKESTWGRNIQAKRSFRVSNKSYSLTSSLPATLPDRRDVMIFEGMHSESTNSYTRALESVHPGNQKWKYFVKFLAPGYDKFSITLQEHIRRHMLETIQQESRRILIQNEQLNWTSVSPEVGHIIAER